MIIKSFVAESASAALKRVRAELTGDAVVLKTQRIPNGAGGYYIEVTACVDKPSGQGKTTTSAKTEVATARRISAPVWTRTTTENKLVERPLSVSIAPADSSARRLLSDADLPFGLIDKVVSASTDATQLRQVLRQEIQARIDTAVSFKASDRVLVLGPAGSGKTAVVGKLAAQLIAQRTKVVLSGLNQGKVGAIDELQTLADLVGVAEEIETSIDRCPVDQSAVVLIDGGGMGITTDDIERLKVSHVFLTVPATWRTSDLAELIRRVATLGITHVILTMTDQTHRLGGLFTACDGIAAKIAFVNDSPGGIACLRVPSADELSDRILSGGGAHAIR